MRNVFDQYDQPENRVTHALLSCLHNDRQLIRPFLNMLGLRSIPKTSAIRIGQQLVPGTKAEADKEGADGLPDGCFYTDDGWAVLIESKVQAPISVTQLKKHRKTAARYGYDNAHVVLIAVDSPRADFPHDMQHVMWKQVYQWFVRKSDKSQWARRFVDYMEVFESKMIAKEYNIRGTLTMFSGFRFDEDHPYTYREGKRLMRLVGQAFRKNKRLVKELEIDPKGKGRSALTRGWDDSVWDFIPLKVARGSSSHTAYPHATLVIAPDHAAAAITVPNGVRGGIKSRIKAAGPETLEKMLARIERNLRPVGKKVPGMKPMVYLLQRRYKSQRSIAELDGRIEVDLRTLVKSDGSELKHQPEWLEAIHGLLANKQTNIQLGVEVHLPYAAPVMQKAGALEVMVDAWIALRPMLDFILKGALDY